MAVIEQTEEHRNQLTSQSVTVKRIEHFFLSLAMSFRRAMNKGKSKFKVLSNSWLLNKMWRVMIKGFYRHFYELFRLKVSYEFFYFDFWKTKKKCHKLLVWIGGGRFCENFFNFLNISFGFLSVCALLLFLSLCRGKSKLIIKKLHIAIEASIVKLQRTMVYLLSVGKSCIWNNLTVEAV